MNYIYKTDPYDHQREVFEQSRDRKAFALLMEMRTGKSKVIIDTAAWLHAKGEIQVLLIIAPNGVHRQWVDIEMVRHCPDHVRWNNLVWRSTYTNIAQILVQAQENSDLMVVAMNYEAVNTKKGEGFCRQLIGANPTMMVLDESHRIKTPSAQRTKAIIRLGKNVKYKRILTGTPITQGPLDVYTQFNFLDPSIIDCGSYYAFKNRYAVWKTRHVASHSFKELIDYRDLDELTERTSKHSYRVTAAECLNLPPRQYTRLGVHLSKQQARLYQDLKNDIIAEFRGEVITAPLAMVRLLRLQQIIGGFFPREFDAPSQEIDEICPRLELLLDYLKNAENLGKVIIWARFVDELEMLHRHIHPSIMIHGGVKIDDRVEMIERFKTNEDTRYMIANQATAGEGLDLSAADTMVFYSNSFKLTERLQAEARTDHPNRTIPTTVIDMVAKDTVDERVINALRKKQSLADQFTGDALKEWLV